MSSTGILIIILAAFILLNIDKIAWVMVGALKFNTKGFTKKPEDK